MYRFTADKVVSTKVLEKKPIAFHCFIFSKAITNGEWPIIGHIDFPSEESSWPPPMWHCDDLTDVYEIRHRGKSRLAAKSEIKGLDEEIMWYPKGLINELEKKVK